MSTIILYIMVSLVSLDPFWISGFATEFERIERIFVVFFFGISMIIDWIIWRDR